MGITQLPVVEAFVGEYASGKSEIAVNRALELKNQERKVTLVDLDTVEPFYTLRPIKKMLEEYGLRVIGLSEDECFGLGETGAMINPGARWALRNEGDIILDVGYGVHGARTLNLVEGADDSEYLRVMAVVNYMRPMTGSIDRIKEYLGSLGRIDAVVANTHLGDETTLDIVLEGTQKIFEAASQLHIPVEYAAICDNLKEQCDEEELPGQIQIKWIKRYMHKALW